MKKRLKVYTLEWVADFAKYGLAKSPRWVLKDGRRQIVEVYRNSKALAIQLASGLLNAFFLDRGQHSELRIRNKNGTFGKARTYPRSADPRRSKG